MINFHKLTSLGYIGRFFQQWGLTSATGFMWSLVPEVVSFGDGQSKKRVAGIINYPWDCSSRSLVWPWCYHPGYINAAFTSMVTKATQSASALMGLQWSLVWLPIIMAVLAAIIIKIYPLTDDKVFEMNREIEARRNK